MNRYFKTVDFVANGMAWLAAIVLIAVTILTCMDVILRYFGHPITGVYDTTCVLGSAIFSLPIAHSFFKGYQVTVDSIFRHSPRAIRIIIDSIVCLLSMTITGMIAWRAMYFGHEMYVKGRLTDTVPIPLWPFIYIMMFGFFVYCLALVAGHLRTLIETDRQASVLAQKEELQGEVKPCQ